MREDRRVWIALAAMALVSLAVRLNNVVAFPGMRAPDGFGHFTYVWHLASTGTIPLATAGWSFFHPPLYYAWMALVWNTFAGLDPAVRLQIGTGVIAAAGLVHAAVAFAFARRRHGTGLVAVAAAGFLLFLPIQLFTAGYLGNEALHAVLASIALLATIRLLERPSMMRALALGVVLGLALLTKFTALAVIAGTFAAVLASAWSRRRLRDGIAWLALASAAVLATSGWFYARNLEVYGTPFRMSRDTLPVALIENTQMQGRRSLAEFLLFDPMIVVRPQWPRGYPLTSDRPLELGHDPVRESVWTGMFAGTFFDSVGNQVLPSVTTDETARRAGQVLLTLALVPTALMLAGLVGTALRLARTGWNDPDGLMVVYLAAAIGLFVVGAIEVPMHAAIKATYLSHAAVPFAYFFAAGLSLLRRLPRVRALALGDAALLAVASVVVFSQGVFLWRDYIERTSRIAIWQNLEGVLAFAAGDTGRARTMFTRAAAFDHHLAEENLAALALADGQVLESVYRMRLAARLQPSQSIGWKDDRARLDRETRAEYLNSIGAGYLELGWLGDAERALTESLELDATIPETHFDLGLVELARAAGERDGAQRRALEESAAKRFERARELDPGFEEAGALADAYLDPNGTCAPRSRERHRACWTPRRAYPLETATGFLHASAITRRRRATRLPDVLRAELERRGCATAAAT